MSMLQLLGGVCDKFSGEAVLAGQEVLTELRRHVIGWTASALCVFLRYEVTGDVQHQAHADMIDVNHVS